MRTQTASKIELLNVKQQFVCKMRCDGSGDKNMHQEQIGEGGTVHITKTIIGGDGSVRREMRFRTQSASRAESRSR